MLNIFKKKFAKVALTCMKSGGERKNLKNVEIQPTENAANHLKFHCTSKRTRLGVNSGSGGQKKDAPNGASSVCA